MVWIPFIITWSVLDAMLKYTGVDLELITDPDMHQMAGKSTHGY